MPRRRNGPGGGAQGGYGAQPQRVATGLPYGENQARRQAQQAIPLPDRQLDLGPVGLARPTDRPNEPVTTGAPLGAGTNQMPVPVTGAPNPDIGLWLQWMPMLELLVSQPGASVETRQFYRRLRAALGPAPFEGQ